MSRLFELRHRRQPLTKTFRDDEGAQWLLVCAPDDAGLNFQAHGPHVPDGIGDAPPTGWPEPTSLGRARGWAGAEAALSELVATREVSREPTSEAAHIGM